VALEQPGESAELRRGKEIRRAASQVELQRPAFPAQDLRDQIDLALQSVEVVVGDVGARRA
jgi:hypothetical protein